MLLRSISLKIPEPSRRFHVVRCSEDSPVASHSTYLLCGPPFAIITPKKAEKISGIVKNYLHTYIAAPAGPYHPTRRKKKKNQRTVKEMLGGGLKCSAGLSSALKRRRRNVQGAARLVFNRENAASMQQRYQSGIAEISDPPTGMKMNQRGTALNPEADNSLCVIGWWAYDPVSESCSNGSFKRRFSPERLLPNPLCQWALVNF